MKRKKEIKIISKNPTIEEMPKIPKKKKIEDEIVKIKNVEYVIPNSFLSFKLIVKDDKTTGFDIKTIISKKLCLNV